jgi:hypothetical protein
LTAAAAEIASERTATAERATTFAGASVAGNTAGEGATTTSKIKKLPSSHRKLSAAKGRKKLLSVRKPSMREEILLEL